MWEVSFYDKEKFFVWSDKNFWSLNKLDKGIYQKIK